jgi:hypothetical protein
MSIIFQKKLKEWCDKGNFCKKTQDSDISLVESKYSISLPQSYKEFLSTCGEYFIPFTVLTFKDWLIEKDFNTLTREWLSDADIKLKKPYWVFAEDQGVIYFFYLDEGDDPPVWVCEIEMKRQEGYEWLGKGADSFSTFINGHIDYYEKNKKYLR